MTRHGFLEANSKNHVAALIAAITNHIFPIFLMIVVLPAWSRAGASQSK